jgi:hypothetical protein
MTLLRSLNISRVNLIQNIGNDVIMYEVRGRDTQGVNMIFLTKAV